LSADAKKNLREANFPHIAKKVKQRERKSDRTKQIEIVSLRRQDKLKVEQCKTTNQYLRRKSAVDGRGEGRRVQVRLEDGPGQDAKAVLSLTAFVEFQDSARMQRREGKIHKRPLHAEFEMVKIRAARKSVISPDDQ
jgi:hypothetical protein